MRNWVVDPFKLMTILGGLVALTLAIGTLVRVHTSAAVTTDARLTAIERKAGDCEKTNDDFHRMVADKIERFTKLQVRMAEKLGIQTDP